MYNILLGFYLGGCLLVVFYWFLIEEPTIEEKELSNIMLFLWPVIVPFVIVTRLFGRKNK